MDGGNFMAKKKKPPVDPRQQELHDLIELKKMRQAAAEHRTIEPDLPPPEEKIVPKTFKEKWDNYWYHYKGLTWGSLVAAVLAVWLVKDLFFATKPDMTLNIATSTTLSVINTEMEADLYPYISDYNGDGQTVALLSETSLGELSDPQMMMANQQKFVAILATGDELIFLLDQDGYDFIFEGSNDHSMFIDMEKLYPGLEIAKGDKLYLDELPLGKEWKLDRLEDEDFFLCVRYLGNSAKDNEKNRETLQNCLDFVQNIIVAGYPQWEGKQPTYDPATMNMDTLK